MFGSQSLERDSRIELLLRQSVVVLFGWLACGGIMRRQWIGLAILFWAALSTVTSLSAEPYGPATVMAAQEALTRLGYDVGNADGKWGAKSRKALNELREKNGLPPADGFAGSSLELIHRLSPGATTLPHPGIMVTDPVERRAFLTLPANTSVARTSWCPAKVDEVDTLGQLLARQPVAVVNSTSGPQGYITHGDDWFTPIMQTLIGAHDLCLVGVDESCKEIVSLMSKWASADALAPGAKRSQERFEDISWIANSFLRNFIFAYADARKLTPVGATEDAAILDWLKRRIDEYHYIRPSGQEFGTINYTEASNHALAHMMPALAFGALVGDRSMMEGAFDTWRTVLETMRADGSLPLEARRGARSLQYTNFQLAQLISTAEVAWSQDIDLYAQAPSAEKTIPKAVEFLLDAYENFDTVEPYAKANIAAPSDDYSIPYIIQMHVGWLPTYFARFGADDNVRRMGTLTIDARICSSEATSENKLSRADRVCAGNTGEPVSFVSMLALGGGNVGEAPNYFMGYPAQCLQGQTPSWPVGHP